MAENRPITAERERRILELLHETPVLKVPELASALGVSPATVRRDLQSMHERGLLQRVRGGATLHRLTRTEPMFDDKQVQNAAAKRAIALAALDLVDDHDHLYLDGGSTVLALAELLHRRRDLTVVTNSLAAAAALLRTDHRVILVGGELRRISRSIVGTLSSATLGRLHFDKAFMGTTGFTLEDGMTAPAPEEAFTKAEAMRRADQVILLIDSSKFGVSSFARSGSPDDIDVLITERIAPPFRKQLEEQGIRVIVSTSPASLEATSESTANQRMATGVPAS